MALKFNLDKVICINLKSHNEQQLDNIANAYTLSLDSLLELKHKGVLKIWVESAGDWVIAALDEDRPEQMYICEKYCPITKREKDSLKKIQPIKTPPNGKKIQVNNKKSTKIKSKNNLKLNIDSILDKINLTGINSLTQEELNFLKNF